jgi:hypothetical protein
VTIARRKISRYVLCLRNRGFAASLEVRKVYRLRPDPEAERHRLLRVIDETGEDYLYPEKLFVPIDIPREAIAVLSSAV